MKDTYLTKKLIKNMKEKKERLRERIHFFSPLNRYITKILFSFLLTKKMLRLSLLSGKASPLYPSILSSSLYRSGSTVLPSIVPIVSSLPLLLSSSSGSFIVRHLTSSSVRMYSASSTIYSSSSTATTPPVQFNGGKTLDETLVRKIGERDSAMRTAYDTVPKIYPVHAQPDDPITGQITNPIDQHIAFRKRLLYRSKQRGW